MRLLVPMVNLSKELRMRPKRAARRYLKKGMVVNGKVKPTMKPVSCSFGNQMHFILVLLLLTMNTKTKLTVLGTGIRYNWLLKCLGNELLAASFT